MIGWVTHGNLYVTLMLLVGAAEVVLRRWRSLSWHLPLLLLMGVMITAPANNFERHMLPVAFVFGSYACNSGASRVMRDRLPARTWPVRMRPARCGRTSSGCVGCCMSCCVAATLRRRAAL